MLICHIVGARPNFMKIAPVLERLAELDVPQILIHTGQHYDPSMSAMFFDELGLPEPTLYLGVGSDTHARQTAKIMVGLEEAFTAHKPSLIIVPGDVNSTVGAALVAAKLQLPVAHLEAGLRSFDRTMPEEINRVVTDHLSELLFTTEESGSQNLLREGIRPETIHFVGNCMVDTLRKHLSAALLREPWKDFGFSEREYLLLTLHRPVNVDDSKALERILKATADNCRGRPVIFPVHPRTATKLADLPEEIKRPFICVPPMPYLKFLGTMAQAKLVVTDSGGVQEETTALGVPCLTFRANTERPSTLKFGTNRLISGGPEELGQALHLALSSDPIAGSLPPLWDGKAGDRVAAVVTGFLTSSNEQEP